MDIVEKMNSVGIRASQRNSSFGSGTEATYIFGMEIDRRNTPEERILVWPGSDNEVTITDAHRGHRQVVMQVREPERAFRETMIFDQPSDLATRLRSPGVKLISIDAPHVATIERKTPADRRAFLVGIDERAHFIAQLPEMSAMVEAAHAVLRPAGISDRAVRQGEWFLDPVDDATQTRLEAGLASRVLICEHEKPLPDNKTGSPHVVDAMVKLKDVTYVRGMLRQAPRHAPLGLGTRFHTIHRNREIPQPRGFGWVD